MSIIIDVIIASIITVSIASVIILPILLLITETKTTLGLPSTRD